MSEGVDTAVIECGVGGEFDSTNLIVKPSVAGITSLGIDHTAILGATIEEIAWHKAGIMKPGSRAFTVEQPAEALAVLQKRAKERESTLEICPRLPVIEKTPLGLAGDFQKINASLAVVVAAAHLENLGHPVSLNPLPQEFSDGLLRVRWGGRCETRSEQCLTWHIDGGHTLESIQLVGEWFASQIPPMISINTTKRKRILIFNQQTRDAVSLAKALHTTLANALGAEKPFTHAIFCRNVTFRESGYRPDLTSMNTNKQEEDQLVVQKRLAETWKTVDEETDVSVVATIEDAVERARSIAGQDLGDEVAEDEKVKVLVTGSLHLVGGFLEVLEADNKDLVAQ